MSLPYDYYPAVLYAIGVLGQGNTLSQSCLEANVPVETFKRYVAEDAKLTELFVEAEQQSYDAMADALVNIDNHKVHGQSDPKMAKVISDNIKWVLGKRRPKDYGERVTVDTNITMDIAITTALDAARNRSAVSHDVIDAIELNPVAMSEDDAILRELLS